MDSHVDIRQESVMQAFAKSLLSPPSAFMRPTQAKRCDLLHMRHISTGAFARRVDSIWTDNALVALRGVDQRLVVVIIRRKFIHVARKFLERHDTDRRD